MKKYLLLALALLASSNFQYASASEELAIQYACVACHELDYTRIGPAYYDVADRYRGTDEEMIKELARRVREGTTGNWGMMQMTPQPTVSEETAETLVRWVLSLQRPE